MAMVGITVRKFISHRHVPERHFVEAEENETIGQVMKKIHDKLGIPSDKQSWEVGECVPMFERVPKGDIKNEVIYKKDDDDTNYDYDSDDTMKGEVTHFGDLLGYMSTNQMILRGGGKRGRVSSSGRGNSDTQDRQTKCVSALKSFASLVAAEGVSSAVVGELQGDFQKITEKVDGEDERVFTSMFFKKLTTKELKSLLKTHASTKDTNAKMTSLSRVLYKSRHKSIADATNQLELGTSSLAKATELSILSQFSDGENIDWSAFSDAITTEIEERAKATPSTTTRSVNTESGGGGEDDPMGDDDDDDDDGHDDNPKGSSGKKTRGRPPKKSDLNVKLMLWLDIVRLFIFTP